MSRYDAAQTGWNPLDTGIGPDNVADLATKWSGGTGDGVASAPAVAGGVVYVRSVNGMLYAFDAAGGTGCSAAPTTCAPLWTARTAAPLISPSTSAPAVADGVVFVGGDHLYAFDAAGEKGCSGTPKTCTPLWTGDTESVWTAPVVAGGVVYVTANDAELHAFDAKGVKGCSGRPVTCTSLWTASTGVDSLSSPAVADGVVYVGGAHFYAFDATGNTKCSGHPKTCGPLWMIGSESYSSPAVADGVVYFTGAATLYAYVLEKIRRCQGGGLVCSPPLWTAKTDSGRIFDSSAAVANGVVYIGGDDDKLYAFDAAGTTGCQGKPRTCSPVWTGTTGGAVQSSPAVANGVVYAGSGDQSFYAFDAAGHANCSPTPKVCSPLWATPLVGVPSSPAVANGVVYVGSHDLYAFGLPTP